MAQFCFSWEKSVSSPAFLLGHSSDNGVGCMQQENTHRKHVGCAGSSCCSFCSGLLEQSLPMSEDDICHQKGKHTLEGTPCTVFIAAAASPESHSQRWLMKLPVMMPTNLCGPGTRGWRAYYLVSQEGVGICFPSSGSQDHNLTKADAVCWRNY